MEVLIIGRGKQMKTDIIGKKFGRLTVLDEYDKIPNGTNWKCRCDCGNELFVYRGKLTNGHTQSCGCITKTLNGLSDTRLYRTWWGIKERCYSPRHESYRNYGAKGIKLCKEWQDFMIFYNWSMKNGYTDDLSIDRLDENKDYSPDNCQWILLGENVAKANKKTHRRKTDYTYYAISPEGVRYEFENAATFAEEHNLNANSLRRVARGERPHYKQWQFGYTNERNV